MAAGARRHQPDAPRHQLYRPLPDGLRAQGHPARLRPDLDTLIDDYLEYNPTRNRALDFLPLFLHLDEDARAGRGGQIR
jgi:hypothetical protein